jgi:hypothetical protein
MFLSQSSRIAFFHSINQGYCAWHLKYSLSHCICSQNKKWPEVLCRHVSIWMGVSDLNRRSEAFEESSSSHYMPSSCIGNGLPRHTLPLFHCRAPAHLVGVSTARPRLPIGGNGPIQPHRRPAHRAREEVMKNRKADDRTIKRINRLLLQHDTKSEELMPSTGSRMSSIRNFQAPAGIYRFFEYPVTRASGRENPCWTRSGSNASVFWTSTYSLSHESAIPSQIDHLIHRAGTSESALQKRLGSISC